jgi:hypothetical protein
MPEETKKLNESSPWILKKYKGESIERVLQDKAYCSWLLTQSWFKDSYKEYAEVIMNGFEHSENESETPEHNKIQAMFLDKDFCLKFFYAAKSFIYKNIKEKEGKAEIYNIVFEDKGHDVNMVISFSYIDRHYVWWDKREPGYKKIRTKSKEQPFDKSEFIKEEIEETSGRYSFPIEIKPVVSDDYPVILRKMKSVRKFNGEPGAEYYLLIDKFESAAISKEQLKKIFKLDNIEVVFLEDVLKQEL